MKGRMVYRMTKMKSKHTLKVYKAGWYQMWKRAGNLLKSWKIPEPGSWDKYNQMGGRMWATPAEYRRNPLSGNRCALVLEHAYDNKVPLDTLKQMRKTCSFLYHLKTGISGKNFPIVDAMMECLDPRGCGPKKCSLTPTKIISPEQLRTAFTKEWTPESVMSLVNFCIGVLAAWDWCVLGARSGCDLGKIKDSEDHHFDVANKAWSTSYVGGRSKLPLHKSGTRAWRAWRKCICPNNEHVSPPEDFEYTFDADGNPLEFPDGLCTTCPLFAGQLLKSLQEDHFRCYKKWTKKRFQKENHGTPVMVAMRWFVHQGVMTWENPFHTNSGRKSLALWCQEVGADYLESVHVSGDLEDVWRKSYQPLLPPCGVEIREQSLDVQVATAALARLRGFFGRDPAPEPLPEGLTARDKTLLLISDRLGIREQSLALYKA